MTPSLPTKLSDLLLLSVSDVRKVRKLKSRRLDMMAFHQPDDGVCYVCMAGAVMDRTLRADPRKSLIPACYDPATEQALVGIDLMRLGALPHPHSFPAHVVAEFGNIVAATYNQERGMATLAAYEKAARFLRRNGL